jgi:hypothetical protein
MLFVKLYLVCTGSAEIVINIIGDVVWAGDSWALRWLGVIWCFKNDFVYSARNDNVWIERLQYLWYSFDSLVLGDLKLREYQSICRSRDFRFREEADQIIVAVWACLSLLLVNIGYYFGVGWDPILIVHKNMTPRPARSSGFHMSSSVNAACISIVND